MSEMSEQKIDIVIFGAGIAGLWCFNRFKKLGYDVLLLEQEEIGCGQTLASQGIIHSGLKYAFAGKINNLAKSISAMPDLWRAALRGEGDVNLSAAKVNAQTQYLLIPSGLMGGLTKLVAKKALGGNVRDVPAGEIPEAVKQAGFKGSVIYMDEPVLDVPSVLRALAQPYKDCIRKIPRGSDPFTLLKENNISAKAVIFTGAASNHKIASSQSHDAGLETQARPLLMGMLKPAPYELYAHLVGNSDKPVATITTHQCEDGQLVWYLGGGVAERAKEAPIQDMIQSTKEGFAKYLPALDLSRVKWAALPIDRIEGKSKTQGWMPDTPTIHTHGNTYYCWPTKLTFAPMLSSMLLEKFTAQGLTPSGRTSDFSALAPADYAKAPWDKAKWQENS